MDEMVDQLVSLPLMPLQGPQIQVERFLAQLHAQNAYLVTAPHSRRAVALDPGYGTFDQIQLQLERSSLALDFILLTHEHYDHMGDVDKLRRHYPTSQVVASAACSACLPDPKRNLSAFHFGDEPRATAPADILFEGEWFNLPWNGLVFSLRRTLGHSPGSICIKIGQHLFTGDTLIKDMRTVVKLPGSCRKRLSESLDWVFQEHAPDTILHPGHGDSLSLQETCKDIHYPAQAERRSSL